MSTTNFSFNNADGININYTKYKNSQIDDTNELAKS